MHNRSGVGGSPLGPLVLLAYGPRSGVIASILELGLVEQRYKAVLEVLDGALSVKDVARRPWPCPVMRLRHPRGCLFLVGEAHGAIVEKRALVR